MCYSTHDKVNLKTSVTYDENLPYGTNGYRTDCNYIQVNLLHVGVLCTSRFWLQSLIFKSHIAAVYFQTCF